MTGRHVLPLYDATEPIACTIGAGEVSDRVELLASLRSRLGSIARGEHGLLLTFPASAAVEADVRRFAVDEKRCCAFWGFAVDTSTAPGSVILRWDAPPAAGDILDRLSAWFAGDAPLTDLAGLL